MNKPCLLFTLLLASQVWGFDDVSLPANPKPLQLEAVQGWTPSGISAESIELISAQPTAEQAIADATSSLDYAPAQQSDTQHLANSQNAEADTSVTVTESLPPPKSYGEIKKQQIAELYPRAKKGDKNAQAQLGELYLNYARLDGTRSPKQVYELAVKWLTKASQKGDAGAKANLRNAKLLLDLIERAEKGNREAAFNLGYAFDVGRVEGKNLVFIQSDEHAMTWYQKAAKKKHGIAANNIATMYEMGQGVTRSLSEAHKWYRLAANYGYLPAQTTVAYYYEKGIGTKQSYKKSAFWYEKAAAKGDARAQNRLGMYYLNGHGVKKSYTRAVKLFKTAATRGNAHAQYNLGNCYVNGWGVKKDQALGYAWLYLASTQMGAGDFNAYSAFDALRQNMTAAQIQAGDKKVAALKKQYRL